MGAGPGDPELITRKGFQLIQVADVILYDFLIPSELLGACRPDAIQICVGKRKGTHTKTQAQINELMVYYANLGKQVVRLKGGDPMVFGRVGEEIDTLTQHKIPYVIVPGVTSVFAGPAAAGIPVTHRDLSRSVAIITGTTASGDVANIPIPVADTLIILMGLTYLRELCDKISSSPGFSDDTPVAVISQACTENAKVVRGELVTIHERCLFYKIPSPALVVIGKVVRLNDVFSSIPILR